MSGTIICREIVDSFTIVVLNSFCMVSPVRKTRSFSLDPEVIAELDRTKGDDSASERVNQLLKLALETERKADLWREAEEFFSNAPDDRHERRAFQKAGLRTLTRE
ncbi:MAG: hypothetical protein WB662_08250 [Methyloceanibacter sp.]